MSNQYEQQESLASLELEETKELDIDDTDIGLLLDRDGNLKTVFGPAEGLENPSTQLMQILEILGIDRLISKQRTLH